MLLAPAVIVFVGIAGHHADAIDHQLAPVLAHSHVTSRMIGAADLGTIARHTDASRDVVQHLHVDGVVGGALIESGGTLTLRVVIYDGDGNLKSLGETPLGARTLSKDELEVFGMNLDEEIGGIAAHRRVAPAAEAMAAAPPPAAAMGFAPAHAPPPAPAHDLAEISFDTDDAAPPAEPHDAHHDAKPTETADAVSLDDVAALNNEPADTGSSTRSVDDGLHLHAIAGLGLAARSFTGPSTLTGYSSSPVGTVHVEAGLVPTAHLALAAMAERAIEMSSPVGTAMASTSMSRWELTAAYTVTHGSIAIAPTIGVGQRSFSIDSTAPQRSPDADYGYVVLGATATAPLGDHFTLRALAAFEPVIGGDEPTAMAFGAASRWALDVGAGLEVRPMAHVFLRAALDYQRFAWSWAAAGTRSDSSAVDSYPTGTLSLGANY
jgi:opacity protein-like surface antigen